MDKLTVTLKTVTPMFLGGAEPNKIAELRAPSIKGALRFWYRAIDPEYNKPFDLSDPKSPTWEEKIFGSTEHGQGCFGIKVYSSEPDIVNPGDNRWKKSSIAYLGYGPIERGVTKRPYIKTGFEFAVEFLFKPTKDIDKLRAKVEGSLWVLLMFGGLGSRSRRAFGSLSVTAIEGASSPRTWNFANEGDYKTALKSFIGGLKIPSGLPKHTSWSNGARCVMLGKGKNGNGDIFPFNNWEEALKWIGAELHKYRSYLPAPPTGERNFQNDHNNIRDYLLNSSTPPSLPQRAVFGLPHNYFFTNSFKGLVCKNKISGALFNKLINNAIVNDEGNHIRFKLTEKNYGESRDQFISRFKAKLEENGIKDSNQQNAITKIWLQSLKGVKGFINFKEDDKDGRRASPLIIHIQEFIDSKACVTVTFMPAKLLPGVTPHVEISGNWEDVLTTHLSREVNVSDDFTAVENFMTRLAGKGMEIK